MRKCTDCKYCLMTDFGYSNWTVEGTDVNCLLRLNPDFPVDNFYGEEEALLFAEKCGRFSPGFPTKVDCDQDEGPLANYSDDPEIVNLLKEWERER